MHNNTLNQLLTFGFQAVIIIILLLGLFRARFRFGLSPLYVTLGVFQPIQMLLASFVYVELLPGLTISPGSVIIFTASLFVILLVYMRDDALEARKVIYGIIAGNLTMILFLWMLSLQLKVFDIPALSNFYQTIFNQGIRVIITGTITLFGDVILIIFVYEAVRRFIPAVPFLRIYLTMLIILAFDTLVFATGAFYNQPNYGSIIASGITGKAMVAIFYAAALAIYLRFVEPSDQGQSMPSPPLRDIFYALTYREKYEIEQKRAKEIIRQSEEKFAKAFRASPDSIIISSLADGRYIEVNDRFLQTTGYSRQEVIGRTALDLNSWANPQDREKFTNLLQKQGNVRNFEADYRQKSGELGTVLISAELIEFENEPCLIAISREITKRKQAALALQQSAEQLRRSHASEQLARQQAEMLRDANIALTQSLGLNKVLEVLQDYLKQFIPFDGYTLMLHDDGDGKDDLLVVAGSGNIWTETRGLPTRIQPPALVKKVISTQKSVIISDTVNYPEWEQRESSHARNWMGVPLVTFGKTVGLYSFNKMEPHIFTEQHQQLAEAMAAPAATAIENAQLYAASRQHTEELELQVKKRTAELERQYQHQAALYEVGKEITATLKLDTMLQIITKNAVRVTGADKSVILLVDVDKKQVTQIVGHGYMPGQLDDFTFEEFGQGISGWVLQHKTPTLVSDIKLDRRNTGIALAKAKASNDKAIAIAPLHIRDEVIGTLTVVNGRNKKEFTLADLDLVTMLAGQAAIAIYNARLYESAQEADRLKSAFLASMSHELRTPLNSIIGFTGIILQGLAGPLNEEQTKQLGMVRSSSRHLLALINDVLDISKIEAGQLEVSLELFGIHSLLEKVVNIVTPLAQEKSINVILNASPKLNQIFSDKRRVEQILINLVNNAIKFSERGDVRIECQPDNGWLVTSVIDTGIGIKSEHMEELFKPFRQLDMGTNRTHEGTGLGLSICQRLVTLLGGEIWAESEWGVGSTFTFTLPLPG